MAWLWRKSLPLAVAGGFEFLFLPLGLYACKWFAEAGAGRFPAALPGTYLGGYSAAYRIILAASLFASSLFLVLLPRFSAPGPGLEKSLRRLFDGMAASLFVPLLAVPFLAGPLLSLLFPKAGWDAETFRYASWALSTMALATYLHVLRMPPLTRALAAGGSWSYCRGFLLAGLANAAAVGAGAFLDGAERLPAWALTGDLAFTAGWMLSLHPRGGVGAWGRLAALGAASAFYLAWARHWA